MRFQLALALFALSFLGGCATERVWHLNVHGRGMRQDAVYDIVRACALEQGYQPRSIPPPTKDSPWVAEYVVTDLGTEGDGESRLYVRPDGSAVVVMVTTQPDPDYPLARQLRANLQRRLTDAFGTKAVSGF